MQVRQGPVSVFVTKSGWPNTQSATASDGWPKKLGAGSVGARRTGAARPADCAGADAGASGAARSVPAAHETPGVKSILTIRTTPQIMAVGLIVFPKNVPVKSAREPRDEGPRVQDGVGPERKQKAGGRGGNFRNAAAADRIHDVSDERAPLQPAAERSGRDKQAGGRGKNRQDVLRPDDPAG